MVVCEGKMINVYCSNTKCIHNECIYNGYDDYYNRCGLDKGCTTLDENGTCTCFKKKESTIEDIKEMLDEKFGSVQKFLEMATIVYTLSKDQGLQLIAKLMEDQKKAG